MSNGWAGRFRQAWGYVKSAVSSALGREESHEQYTAGGGAIPQHEWEDAYALGERMYAQGRAIQDFPGAAIVPRWTFEVVPIDYAGKYHLTAEVEYFNTATGEFETKMVSTNANDLLSRADWEQALLQGIQDTETSAMIDLEQDISFYNFIAEERE